MSLALPSTDRLEAVQDDLGAVVTRVDELEMLFSRLRERLDDEGIAQVMGVSIGEEVPRVTEADVGCVSLFCDYVHTATEELRSGAAEILAAIHSLYHLTNENAGEGYEGWRRRRLAWLEAEAARYRGDGPD